MAVTSAVIPTLAISVRAPKKSMGINTDEQRRIEDDEFVDGRLRAPP
jgi:hypothetical protein